MAYIRLLDQDGLVKLMAIGMINTGEVKDTKGNTLPERYIEFIDVFLEA